MPAKRIRGARQNRLTQASERSDRPRRERSRSESEGAENAGEARSVTSAIRTRTKKRISARDQKRVSGAKDTKRERRMKRIKSRGEGKGATGQRRIGEKQSAR